MFTVRIFSALDKSTWDDYTFNDARDAFLSLENTGFADEPPAPGGRPVPFGYNIYNPDGMCFHSIPFAEDLGTNL